MLISRSRASRSYRYMYGYTSIIADRQQTVARCVLCAAQHAERRARSTDSQTVTADGVTFSR